jgi:hypothetical protein
MGRHGLAWPGDRSEPETEPEHIPQTTRDVAEAFLHQMGLSPTPDAVGQMVEVFLPCLRIMCDRPGHPWATDGSTWRKSGVLGALTDVRKKFDRLWERGWIHGKRHDDSAYDLINFVGFYLRSEDNGWNEWGSPAGAQSGDPL